jgi:Ca-activated chloride channel homolog
MKKYLLLVLLAIICAQDIWASAYGKVSAGNSLYKKGQYDKSLDKYREAQISSPDNPVVYFNIGDALHKIGDNEAAEGEFTKALGSKDKLLRSKAYYNLGNSAFARQKPDEALNFYKKCLELNPKDMDAKYNIEFILNRKNTPQSKKNDKNDKNSKDKDKKQGAASSKENDKDNKDKDKNEKKKNSMSKEDAQRILQYYNDQERNSAQKRKMKNPALPKVDEDW